MRQIKRAIAFIDSQHTGSRYALWPEMFPVKAFDGDTPHIPKISPQQEQLLDYWYRFWAECDEWGVDTLVHLGETVDGNSPAEIGLGLITTDVDVQCLAAAELLRPHVGDRQVVMVHGSGYHVRQGGANADRYVAGLLDAKYLGPLANVQFEGSPHIWNIGHDMSGAYMYPETALGKEIIMIHEKIGQGKYPVDHVDFVVRGHKHQVHEARRADTRGVVCPGWKMYHVIKSQVRYHAKHIPDIGGLIALIYDTGDVEILERTYPTPHVHGQLEVA
jgi:hypothetical protein